MFFKGNNLYIFHATCITRSVRAQVRFCSYKLRVQRTYINIDAKIVDAERGVRPPLKPIVPPCPVGRTVFWAIYCTAATRVRHCCFGPTGIACWQHKCVTLYQLSSVLVTGDQRSEPEVFRSKPGFAWYGNFSRYATAVSHERPHVGLLSFSLFNFFSLLHPLFPIPKASHICGTASLDQRHI